MRANDSFYYLDKGRIEVADPLTMQLYYPIIKADAYILYCYLLAFYDQGKKRHAFHEILNHTLYNMQRFEEALAVLTALDLVRFYQDRQAYIIDVRAPLSKENFLSHALYRHLLEGAIGQVAVSEMDEEIPEARNLSKKFSEVFGNQGEIVPSEHPKVAKNYFDLDSFKRLMRRDGLSFTDEETDLVAIFNLSERYKLTWYDTYQLARETASQNKILVSRMVAKKESQNSPSTNDFSEKEKIVIKEAREDSPEVFLAKIKKPKQAIVTRDEVKILAEMAQMGLLDEVINIMVLYTMNKTQSANLHKNYVLKLANDFVSKGISRADDAIKHLRSVGEKKSQAKEKTNKTNIPKWSNQNYQNQTSQDEQEKLEAYRQKALERLRDLGKED